MKLSLSVTEPAPPIRYVTGITPKGASFADALKPGMLQVIPESEPMVLSEVDADGISPEAVIGVLRSAADEIERFMHRPDLPRRPVDGYSVNRHSPFEVVPKFVPVGAHKKAYPGALAELARAPYLGSRRREQFAPGGMVGGGRW